MAGSAERKDETETKAKTEANSADVHDSNKGNSSPGGASDTNASSNNNTDIIGLLAHALTIADSSQNEAVKDIMTEAINALHYTN